MTALWLCVWGSLAAAAAEPNPYLAQAKVFYQGVDYENCLKRLEQSVRWNNSRQELVEIEIYWGLCQFEDAQRTAARHFALALQLDPGVKLPPFTSPKVVDVFKSVASKVPKPAPAPPAPEPPPPAVSPPIPDSPREVVLAPEPRPELIAPAAPPPPARRVGALPIAFGAAAVAALGTGVYFGATAQQNEGLANSAHFTSDADNYAQQARFDATASNISYAAAAGCAATAVVVYFLTRPKEGP